MHPAFSIVAFTTLSGAGYGLLFWLGIAGTAGLLPESRVFAVVSLGLALAAITIGLLASTFHLGRPERAWRAFSQWRSSWLSREGVASVATYVPAGLLGLGWLYTGQVSGGLAACAFLSAIGAVVTVLCTAYIYRSLKTIAHWHNGWVPANYLALAAMTGAVWLEALAAGIAVHAALAAAVALLSIAVAFPIKLAYWRHIDGSPGISTAESATGLGDFGRVRLLAGPSTSESYLMKEMGFKIARKHAAKLRRVAVAAGFALPFALTLVALLTDGWLRFGVGAIAAVAATLGVLVERWLFFAEAKHTVTLYYGAARA